MKYSIKNRSWKVFESLLLMPVSIAASIGIVRMVEVVEHSPTLSVLVIGSIIVSTFYAVEIIVNHLEE